MLRGLYSGLSPQAAPHDAGRNGYLTKSGAASRTLVFTGLTAVEKSATLIQLMSRWNIKPWALFVLGGLVLLMLVILYLPDVDLPDTAFHGGTAPVVAHAKANSAPTPMFVASVPQVYSPAQYEVALGRLNEVRFAPDPNFRPILLRSIRC